MEAISALTAGILPKRAASQSLRPISREPNSAEERSSSALAKDLEGDLRRTAALEERDREAQVDVFAAGQIGRDLARVAGALQLLAPPGLDPFLFLRDQVSRRHQSPGSLCLFDHSVKRDRRMSPSRVNDKIHGSLTAAAAASVSGARVRSQAPRLACALPRAGTSRRRR